MGGWVRAWAGLGGRGVVSPPPPPPPPPSPSTRARADTPAPTHSLSLSLSLLCACAGQNRLLALNYIHPGEQALVCEAHAQWGRAFQAAHPPLPALTLRDVDTTEGRPLVVRRPPPPPSQPLCAACVTPGAAALRVVGGWVGGWGLGGRLHDDDGTPPLAPTVPSPPSPSPCPNAHALARAQVGYVSPDLFTHSVSYFAEAPLAHHDPSRCRHIIYSCVPTVRGLGVCLCKGWGGDELVAQHTHPPKTHTHTHTHARARARAGRRQD